MNTKLLFSSFPFIVGKSVTLTHITDLDEDALWNIMSDDDVYKYSPTEAVQSRYEVHESILKFNYLFEAKKAIVLGIYSSEHLNKLVGFVELYNFDFKLRAASINIMLSSKYQQRGFAKDALTSFLEYLFEKIGFNRIQGYLLPINYKGKLLLEACGFVNEGTLREAFIWPDKGIIDLSVYSMLPIDYKKFKHPNVKSNCSYIL